MKKCVLGDVADLSLGKMLDAVKNRGQPHDYLSNIDVRWGSFDFDHLKQMRFEEDEFEKYGLRFGDIVMCEGGEPGRCAIWKDERPGMMIQKALHRIRPHDSICGEYLYYFFLNLGQTNGMSGLFKGATIKHLTKNVLEKLEIEFPEKNDQQKVALVFSTIDRNIALNRKRIATLEAMAKEIYDYWFVQFDFPDAHGRPYKSSGGAMVYNPDLKREIPKGWVVKPLGELMKTNASSYSDRTLPCRIRYIDIAAVSKGAVSSKTEYDRDCAPGRARRIAKRGDTIWSSVRPNLKAYALVLNPQADDVFSTGFTVLSPVDVPYGFLYLTVTAEAYVSYLVSRAGNSAYPAVLPSAFGEYEIAVPPRDLLDRFAGQTEGMFELRQNCFDEIQSQSSLRDFLLPLLMNGQVKVG